MPSSEGENIPRALGSHPARRRWSPGSARAALARAIQRAALGALVTALGWMSFSDAALGGDDRALATIAGRPAAARLLAEATVAPVVQEGAGFALTTRAPATSRARSRGTARRVTARLPRDAAGPIEIGVAGESRRVGLRRAFATAASGRLAAGALLYADAARGIDAIWFARRDDAEELLVVREGAAAIAYDLDLPAGSTLVAPPGFPGLVEVRDARGEAWLRMTADAAWDARGRPVPIAVRADAARVWIDVPEGAERPVVVDPAWSGAGRMAFGRAGHTATLLGSGRVLIAGGREDDAEKGATAELYDPATGRFTASARPMSAARAKHSATLLRDGRVLIEGGLRADNEARVAEIWDPVSTTFQPAKPPWRTRVGHTATLLQDGRVLMVGGDAGTRVPDSAETYDVVSNLFSAIPAPTAQPRLHHTATPLADGRVLLAGGDGDASALSTEIFDPGGSTFVLGTEPLAAPRRGHTATLLRDGQILIAGGDGLEGAVGPSKGEHRTAELLDPTGAIPATTLEMASARASHTATLLPSGKVLLVGGIGADGATFEIFDPELRAFEASEKLLQARHGGQTATLLPSGAVLIAGGYAGSGSELLVADVEIFDPLNAAYPETAKPMEAPRVHHTATRLLDGRVLVFGGLANASDTPIAELYDRATDSFKRAGQGNDADDPASTILVNRSNHTATRLSTGEVLITGGTDTTTLPLRTALLYDPVADRFSAEVDMNVARVNHTATALPSGKVLIAGGIDGEGRTATRSERYARWEEPGEPRGFVRTKGQMTTGRTLHSATLLPSGEVLLVGGTSGVTPGSGEADNIGNAELYDPLTDSFRPTGALVGPSPPAGQSTATLLPSGEVLVVGVGSPELYDPAAGEFRVNVSASGSGPRLFGHVAALLPSGRVMLAGGTVKDAYGPGQDEIVPTPLIYTPASGKMEATALGGPTSRFFANATLLATGEVLITGGDKDQNVKFARARRWSEAPDVPFRPRITGVSAGVSGDRATTITGDWGSLGPDTGGGSSSSSAANHPIAIWMPWTGGAVVGRTGAWTESTAVWTPPHAGFVGSGLLFVSSGGVVSEGVEITIAPGAACTSNLDCSTGQVCAPDRGCVDPVDAGPPARGCAIASGGEAPGAGPAIALLLGVVIAALRRGERARPTSRCRAGRCSPRLRARRAPARPRA